MKNKCSLLLVFVCFFMAFNSKASEVKTRLKKPIKTSSKKSVFLGHLLSSTTHMPQANTITAGSHLLAYSPSDNFMFGTATFFDLFYNAPNLYLKVGDNIDRDQKWSVQMDYLKTIPSRMSHYDMENFILWGAYSNDVKPFYTVHLNVNYMYYFAEYFPHSLRMEPYNDDPYSLSISALNEIKLHENVGLAFETAIHGLNYYAHYYHFAGSIRAQNNHLVINFGASVTTLSREVPEERVKKYSYGQLHSMAIHPEVSIQAFF